MLSWIYSHEYGHGFNPRPGSLDRALAAARRAVDIAPSNHLAQQALGVALFFRKDIAGCLNAAERAMALNPLDGSNEAIFLITFTGDWERGRALVARAMELNPHHPGWYRVGLRRRRVPHGAITARASSRRSRPMCPGSSGRTCCSPRRTPNSASSTRPAARLALCWR